jgi:hypothetical protein
MGGLDARGNHVNNFTAEQMRAVIRLGGAFKASYPHGKILGHSELQRFKDRPLRCPSLDMDGIRDSVTALCGAHTLQQMLRGRYTDYGKEAGREEPEGAG